jgi:hypothetical protein
VLEIKSDFNGADDSDFENDSTEEAGEKDMDDSFMESYSDALNDELSKTTIEETFSRAQRPSTNSEVNFLLGLVSFRLAILCSG